MWEPFLFANGGDWFDPTNEKILIDQEPAVQAAQQDIDFYKNKYVRPEALTDEWAQLIQGPPGPSRC
jgi:ABC-type glycerol-3-phosphate transport system substrate-binding protein